MSEAIFLPVLNKTICSCYILFIHMGQLYFEKHRIIMFISKFLKSAYLMQYLFHFSGEMCVDWGRKNVVPTFIRKISEPPDTTMQ